MRIKYYLFARRTPRLSSHCLIPTTSTPTPSLRRCSSFCPRSLNTCWDAALSPSAVSASVSFLFVLALFTVVVVVVVVVGGGSGRPNWCVRDSPVHSEWKSCVRPRSAADGAPVTNWLERPWVKWPHDTHWDARVRHATAALGLEYEYSSAVVCCAVMRSSHTHACMHAYIHIYIHSCQLQQLQTCKQLTGLLRLYPDNKVAGYYCVGRFPPASGRGSCMRWLSGRSNVGLWRGRVRWRWWKLELDPWR